MRAYSIIVSSLFLIVFASEIFDKDKGRKKMAIALTLMFAPIWWYIIKF